MRNELLKGEIFYTLKEAQIMIESWRRHYNTVRPHGALGYRPPAPEVFMPTSTAWPAVLARPTTPPIEELRLLTVQGSQSHLRREGGMRFRRCRLHIIAPDQQPSRCRQTETSPRLAVQIPRGAPLLQQGKHHSSIVRRCGTLSGRVKPGRNV
jgi:hypothetical protein